MRILEEHQEPDWVHQLLKTFLEILEPCHHLPNYYQPASTYLTVPVNEAMLKKKLKHLNIYLNTRRGMVFDSKHPSNPTNPFFINLEKQYIQIGITA